MGKKKYDDDEDDEDEFDNPFDFFKFFKNPNEFSKIFQSKQFKTLFNDIFKKILNNLPPEFEGLSPEDIRKEFMKNKSKFGIKGPIMYGFNIGLGADGLPKFDSFGNIKVKPRSGKPEVKRRVPLVEVNEEEDQIIVIAEMPGITREDIEIESKAHSLIISTKPNSLREYYKEIDLPSATNTDYAKANYRNGILSITLKKTEEKRSKIKID